MRIWVAGVVGGAALGVIAPAWSQTAPVDDPVAACATISNRSARLACYDNAARRRVPPPAAVAEKPLPARRGRPAPARTAAGTPQGFGAEQVRDTRPKAQRPKPVTSASAQVASARDDGVGHWRIALADGAVWQMTQASPYFLPPKAGETVRIRKGALGGYLMDVGRQSSVMVTRIR